MKEVFDAMRESILDVLEATNRTIAARNALKDAECEYILAGLEGKNAETRDANLRAATSAQRDILLKEESALRATQAILDISRINLEEWKANEAYLSVDK